MREEPLPYLPPFFPRREKKARWKSGRGSEPDGTEKRAGARMEVASAHPNMPPPHGRDVEDSGRHADAEAALGQERWRGHDVEPERQLNGIVSMYLCIYVSI